MFSFVENADDFVHFPNVNSKTDFCKAIIDPDFKATLQNIFVSSAVMFGTYEELLTTFFPNQHAKSSPSTYLLRSNQACIYMETFQDLCQCLLINI